MKVSIIIPVFNEKNTITSILSAVESVQLPGVEKEVIIIDDASTDGTREVLKELAGKYTVFFHDRNLGKGAALQTGYNHATGDYIINQDADLEYDPNDYRALWEPVKSGKAEVVFGSRRLDQAKNHYVYKRYLWGGIVTNMIVNVITGNNINDILSGSKLFPRSALSRFTLTGNGFEIETELTIKLLRAGYHVLEVPISYRARTIQAGKKIRPYDALKIIKTAITSRWGRL